MAYLAILFVLILINSSCNGLLVVEDGPKAGELNWAGRCFCKFGVFTDEIGLTDPVSMEDSHPAAINPEPSSL